MNINNIYFYLLLGVFLYFLFTHILENYLVEQENFDPSLVPVSSIVTLAKVAQKLVNGNGTLTNPGNLQIGKDVGATSGNLTVTGKTAIGSTTMGDKTLNVTGTLGVSGDTTVGGKMDITGNTTVGGTMNITGTTALNKPLTIKSGNHSGNTLNLLQGTGTTGEPPYINFMKNDGTTRNTYIMGKPDEILVDKNLSVGGNLNVEAGSGNNGININSSNPFIAFNKKGSSVVQQLYSDGNVLRAHNADFRVEKNLIVDNNLTVTGQSSCNNLTVTGQSSCNTLCVGNNCIDEMHFGMLLGLVNGDGIHIYDTEGGQNFRKTSLSRNLKNDKFDYASYYKTPKK